MFKTNYGIKIKNFFFAFFNDKKCNTFEIDVRFLLLLLLLLFLNGFLFFFLALDFSFKFVSFISSQFMSRALNLHLNGMQMITENKQNKKKTPNNRNTLHNLL